ncbi:MAG: hypothetical protein LUG60_09005 [Erysipelotrichaceae bacterium]|nr:hypothetical protein [Erysipelotrichaceae bacterium]
MIELDHMRKVDFLIKGLPVKSRRRFFKLMDDINPVSVEYLLDKPNNYKKLRSMNYTDKDIKSYLSRKANDFKIVNDFMTVNNRYPVFSNPDDTYHSSLEYHELLDMQPIENLINEFGCKYADYVPKSYVLLKCPLDNYLEGLPGIAIKEFFQLMHDINPLGLNTYEQDLKDYPPLRFLGLQNDQNIEWNNDVIKILQDMNNLMIKYHKDPLISNPSDINQSAIEFKNLTIMKTGD